MLSINSVLSILLPANEIDIPLTFDIYYTYKGESITIGDFVAVDTLCYGPQQLGRVIDIVPNPYHGQSGMCAYVWAANGDGWAEYLPLEIEVY